jgi:hypothetical protein
MNTFVTARPYLTLSMPCVPRASEVVPEELIAHISPVIYDPVKFLGQYTCDPAWARTYCEAILPRRNDTRNGLVGEPPLLHPRAVPSSHAAARSGRRTVRSLARSQFFAATATNTGSAR